jgi:hypothetical protein
MSDDDGIHIYGTPDSDNPPKPAKGGLRGERSGDQANPTHDDGETSGTPGGQPAEDVEDRPNVSTVTPEDYPLDQRARGET